MQVFSVLSCDSRVDIVKALLKKELCCSELSVVAKLNASTISRHLKDLENAGIIESQKKGKQLICKIKNKKLVKQLLETASKIEKR